MAVSTISVFFIALVASFGGTLPFGPINLSVVNTTINRSFKAALRFSTAAALVEILQALVAVRFFLGNGTDVGRQSLG